MEHANFGKDMNGKQSARGIAYAFLFIELSIQ